MREPDGGSDDMQVGMPTIGTACNLDNERAAGNLIPPDTALPKAAETGDQVFDLGL